MGSVEKQNIKRYKTIASRLPLIRGSVITPEGKVIDIADVIGIEKTPIDPQLAKAQAIFPYVRDTIILENGQTCSLTDLISAIITAYNGAVDIRQDLNTSVSTLQGEIDVLTSNIVDDTREGQVGVLLQNNMDVTFTSTSISRLTVEFPQNVSHGYVSGLNFRTTSTVPTVIFENLSELPLKLVVNGVSKEVYTPTADRDVQSVFYSDGINLYGYINEV